MNNMYARVYIKALVNALARAIARFKRKEPLVQARSYGVIPNATPGQQDAIFFPPLGIFLKFFIVVPCCFVFVAKLRSPKFWLRSTLVFVTCKESQSFPECNLHI